jgi:eukaryotic-like serine/threonine-protein kinase
VKRPFEDAWPEVGPYLDEVLELGREERQAWLDELEARAPDIAAQLREYLIELAHLEEQDFLGSSPAAVLSDATLAGQRLGSYTLDRPLGHGGMGTVWLAHRSDGRFESQAAVKLLNAALIGHPSEQRFAREGNVLARLRHPNIAHLLDAGVAEGRQPYLILEYVKGERIDRYCDRARLSIEQRVVLFLDVLAAVTHAHSNLIVHRDLKPANILVTDHGVVKLLDFGVAALLSPVASEATGQLTRHAAPGLTPEYAAPEQLLGESITTATDVYALGLVLFVLLAGRHPALPEGKTPAELMRLTVDTEAPRASEIAIDIRRGRQLRGDLDNIVGMALRKNPTERYTTVDLFAQDLRRYLALEPVSARPSSLRYRVAKFVRRHFVAVATPIAIAIVLICAVIVTTQQMVEARQQRDQAHYQSRRAESTSDFLELLMLSDGGPDRPALSVEERLELGVDLLNKQYRDDPKFVGRMTLQLAVQFSKHDNTRRANELYERAYAIGRQTHDTELMVYAQCYRAYEEAYADINDGGTERIEEAERLLSKADNADPTLQADCLMAKARVQQRLGDTRSAETLVRRGMSILEANGSTYHASYVYLLDELGNIYLARNQPHEVLRIDRLAGDILDRNGRGGTASRLIYRQNEAVSLTALGEISEALAQQEVINMRMRELETPGQEPFPYRFNYATSLLRMAQPARALQALDGVLDRAQQTGNPHAIRQTLFLTGSAFLELARWDEAAAALNEAARLAADGTSNENVQAHIESLRARLDLARGDIDAAHRHRDAALEFAGYRTEKPLRALARVLLVAAEIAFAEGAGADAERFAGDALAISESVARGLDTSADVGEALLRLAQARIAASPAKVTSFAGRVERASASFDQRTSAGADTKSTLERAVRCLTNGLVSNHPLTREARSLLENRKVVPSGSPAVPLL